MPDVADTGARTSLSSVPGVLFDGLAATQCVDSSGEVLEVAGVDCSAIDSPDGIPLNLEHKPGEVPLGEVLTVHKILSEADVQNERQRRFWLLARRTPCIYVVCRLYDAAGNPDAIKAAASLRDRHARGLPSYCRLSIEGSTLGRDGRDSNRIKASVFRKLAVTWAPCNKTAVTELLADPSPPDGFPAVVAKSEVRGDHGSYVGGAVVLACDPLMPVVPLADVHRRAASMLVAHALRKALDAGSPGAAPSALTGGAALQREDSRVTGARAAAALRDWGFRRYFNKDEFKAFCKHRLPDVSEGFLDHFADVAQHLQVQVRKAEGCGDADVARGVAELAKAAEDAALDLRAGAAAADPLSPEVYAVRMPVGGSVRHVGRLLVDGGDVHHLEDNYGLLHQAAPSGPMSPFTAGRVSVWRGAAPEVAAHGLGEPVAAQQTQGDANGTDPEPAQPVVVPAPVRQAPVFHYFRAGMVSPHVVEFGPNGAALDGTALQPDEVALILQNVRDGLATLRYALGTMQVAKSEDLAKADEPMPAVELLRRLRAGVAAGTVQPEVERAATYHIMVDPETGLGNRLAYQEFVRQRRPGVYAIIDGNGLKHLNDTQGHLAGDAAIRALAGALRHGSDQVGTVKLFRHGGDEALAYAPTFEDAAAFVHHAAKHLDTVPPVGGTHRVSASFGLGPDVETADRAMYEAKRQKVDSTGQPVFPPGRAPNLAHSLVAGTEGPVPLHGTAVPRELLPAVDPQKAA